jgi:hypothetical protein
MLFKIHTGTSCETGLLELLELLAFFAFIEFLSNADGRNQNLSVLFRHSGMPLAGMTER